MTGRATVWLVAILMVTVLPACSVTRVERGNSLIQSDLSESYANVYFIRPKTEHPQGFADNPLLVDVNGERLMQLGKGEHTMVRLKARDINITMRDQTQVRGRWEVKELAQTRKFNLEPSQTYYILAKNVDGEFRGVTFVPESISQFDAEPLMVSKAGVNMGGYVTAQYGFLTSQPTSMGNVGVVAGVPVNKWFSVEGQATTTIIKGKTLDVGQLSSNSIGVFGVMSSSGDVYGKARLGVAHVGVNVDALGSDAANGIAYGVGGGVSLGEGAIEVEYTKLPTIKDFAGIPGEKHSHSYLSVGYVHKF